MPRVEAASAVNEAWASTLASYKQALSRKELLVIEAITSPADIARHIEDLEAKTHAGKRGALADRVHAITSRLTQFSNAIGAITSSNTEASLIWGSLKLLLTMVHQSSEEYEKICQSILAVSETFPIVSLLTETFDYSKLVCGHVVVFYTSVLKFWSKALKFYKRHRIFNFLRTWHDFDSEFGDLDRSMKREGKMIEKAATAVHINESKMARIEQESVIVKLVEAKKTAEKSDRHLEVAKWLAPLNYEAGYFVDDLRSADASRHPGTCTWILDRPEFNAWIKSGPDDAIIRVLWLTGVPGAGKTVLSSFVINRCSQVSDVEGSPPIFHFFFKMTDSDKNSVLAFSRSFLYQLYSLFPAKLSAEIISLRDDSGKERALSEQRLWDLFIKHVKDLPDLFIVLDALDECVGVDVLLGHLTSLLQCCRARVFLVSRKERSIALALADYPHIVIGHEDVDADIRSYVTTEIEEIPRFQGKPIQRRMVNAVSSEHGGMFLWAYLMVKELKELGTIKQVDDALKSLPTGLEEMHEAIITRLDATLHKSHRELAIKILMWVVCAVRPLSLSELREVLRFEIRESSAVGPSPADENDGDDLLYSAKDIELACGALVICRSETLHLIHLSTKEILMRRPPNISSDDSRLGFYVDAPRENPRMGVLCVSYISTCLNGIDSVTRHGVKTLSRLQSSKAHFDLENLVTKSPFIEYAAVLWQAHLIDGKISLELENLFCWLRTLLTCRFTVLWIELCVSLHQDITWTLERSCKEIVSWADDGLVPVGSLCHEAIGFFLAWSSAVVSILEQYARVIERAPNEVHYLDLEGMLLHECGPSPKILPAYSTAAQERHLREPISEIRAMDIYQANIKVEPCRQLQSNLHDPLRNHELGFILYDSTRDVYFSADSYLFDNTEELRVQERATGRRLEPVKSALDFSNCPQIYLMNAILCPAKTYLAILYVSDSCDFITTISIVERHLDFRNVRDRRPWARRLHCFKSRNSFFLGSCLDLTVSQEGYFYSPSGQIHPERGIHKRLPTCLVGSGKTPSSRNRTTLVFSGNGQTMIRMNCSIGLIEQISWLEDIAPEIVCSDLPNEENVTLRAISQTARFMVYETSSITFPTSTTCYLLDSQNHRRFLIKDPSPHDLSTFYFMQDEKSFLRILERRILERRILERRILEWGSRQMLTQFSRWAMTEHNIVLETEANLSIPEFYLHTGHTHDRTVCVDENAATITLVNMDRILYEVDLARLNLRGGTLAPPEGLCSPQQHFCQRSYHLSHNGRRLAGVSIHCPRAFASTPLGLKDENPELQQLNEIHMELRFADLSATDDQMERIELSYSLFTLSGHHRHKFTFSPDLSMVQAGLQIFDLLAPGQPTLSFSDSPFSTLAYEGQLYVSFSSCNGYLTVINDQDTKGLPPSFGLFRIHRSAGIIEKIAISGVEDLVADKIWALFHPNLPLLVLSTCVIREKLDGNDNVVVKLMEVDLQERKAAQIATTSYCLHRPGYPKRWLGIWAAFSDRGSFCLLEHPFEQVLRLKSLHLVKNQAKLQIPAVWSRDTSYNGRFYDLYLSSGTQMVILSQIADAVDKDGLRGSTKRRFCVELTSFPVHLVLAEAHLLAGESADDFVRVLFLPVKGPPEVKHLHLTLNQILAALEEVVREYKSKVDEGSKGEHVDVSQKKSTELDLTEGSASVETE